MKGVVRKTAMEKKRKKKKKENAEPTCVFAF